MIFAPDFFHESSSPNPNDTGDKFATGINDTGSKFANGVNETFLIEDFFHLPFPFSAKFETALMV